MTGYQTVSGESAWQTPQGRERRSAQKRKLVCDPLHESKLFMGEGRAEWTGSGHDAEIVWCLIFPKVISKLEISEDEPCLLQGAIRQMDLDTSNAPCFPEPQVKPTILAVESDGARGCLGGMKTTIREIADGSVGANMQLEYIKENMQGKVDRQISVLQLKGLPLYNDLLMLQKRILAGDAEDVRIVLLRPGHNSGGYVQERWLKYRSVLTAVKGSSWPGPVNADIHFRLISDVVSRREYIKFGTAATLTVRDKQGACIGRSFLYV